MLRLRRKHTMKAADAYVIGLEIDLELVHSFQVECDRSLAAVDFEAVPVFAPRRHARRFDGADGAVLETGKRDGRIIDGHATPLPGVGGEWPLLDECLEVARNLGNLANEEPGEVDHVRDEVAQRAGPS